MVIPSRKKVKAEDLGSKSPNFYPPPPMSMLHSYTHTPTLKLVLTPAVALTTPTIHDS